ncbi:MAG: hypothetical protein LBU18_01995 [Treponema sp.]|nr:hypothetical protein [Treponema sp.]
MQAEETALEQAETDSPETGNDGPPRASFDADPHASFGDPPGGDGQNQGGEKKAEHDRRQKMTADQYIRRVYLDAGIGELVWRLYRTKIMSFEEWEDTVKTLLCTIQIAALITSDTANMTNAPKVSNDSAMALQENIPDREDFMTGSAVEKFAYLEFYNKKNPTKPIAKFTGVIVTSNGVQSEGNAYVRHNVSMRALSWDKK